MCHMYNLCPNSCPLEAIMSVGSHHVRREPSYRIKENTECKLKRRQYSGAPIHQSLLEEEVLIPLPTIGATKSHNKNRRSENYFKISFCNEREV